MLALCVCACLCVCVCACFYLCAFLEQELLPAMGSFPTSPSRFPSPLTSNPAVIPSLLPNKLPDKVSTGGAPPPPLPYTHTHDELAALIEIIISKHALTKQSKLNAIVQIQRDKTNRCIATQECRVECKMLMVQPLRECECMCVCVCMHAHVCVFISRHTVVRDSVKLAHVSFYRQNFALYQQQKLPIPCTG